MKHISEIINEIRSKNKHWTEYNRKKEQENQIQYKIMFKKLA
jgi:hypothetical protein